MEITPYAVLCAVVNIAGADNDRVVLNHVYELDAAKRLYGDRGDDTLVLPGTLQQARLQGINAIGFENTIENAEQDARFVDCQFD